MVKETRMTTQSITSTLLSIMSRWRVIYSLKMSGSFIVKSEVLYCGCGCDCEVKRSMIVNSVVGCYIIESSYWN